MMISQGLVGPKGIPKGGPDGQMVNIPSPLSSAKEGRRAVLQATYWLVVRVVRRVLRQIRAPSFNADFKRSGKLTASANGNLKERASKKSF
jgi:hypothetical protein